MNIAKDPKPSQECTMEDYELVANILAFTQHTEPGKIKHDQKESQYYVYWRRDDLVWAANIEVGKRGAMLGFMYLLDFNKRVQAEQLIGRCQFDPRHNFPFARLWNTQKGERFPLSEGPVPAGKTGMKLYIQAYFHHVGEVLGEASPEAFQSEIRYIMTAETSKPQRWEAPTGVGSQATKTLGRGRTPR